MWGPQDLGTRTGEGLWQAHRGKLGESRIRGGSVGCPPPTGLAAEWCDSLESPLTPAGTRPLCAAGEGQAEALNADS